MTKKKRMTKINIDTETEASKRINKNYLFRLVLIRDEGMSEQWALSTNTLYERIGRSCQNGRESSYFAISSKKQTLHSLSHIRIHAGPQKIGICNFKWIAGPFSVDWIKIESCENRWMHVIFRHCFCHRMNTIEFIICDSIINMNYNFIISFYLFICTSVGRTIFVLIFDGNHIFCTHTYIHLYTWIVIFVCVFVFFLLRFGNYFGFIIGKQN